VKNPGFQGCQPIPERPAVFTNGFGRRCSSQESKVLPDAGRTYIIHSYLRVCVMIGRAEGVAMPTETVKRENIFGYWNNSQGPAASSDAGEF
jgi:hypothetical protein